VPNPPPFENPPRATLPEGSDRLVSIIIPVWDTEHYVKRCLDSVLGQSHALLDVIVVDDGSRDGSPRILEEYARRDARLRVLTQENQGPGGARNRALAEARGDWISFVDSDDYIHFRYIERLVEKAASNDADMALCTAVRFNARTDRCLDDPAFSSIWFPISFDGPGFTPAGYGREKEILGVNLAPWAKLFRADLALSLRFPEKARRYEDNPYIYEALLKSRRVVFLREQLYYHMLRADSVQGRITRGEEPAATLEDLVLVRRLCLDIFSSNPALAEVHRLRSADQLWKFFTKLPIRARGRYRKMLRKTFGKEIGRYFMMKRLRLALLIVANFMPYGAVRLFLQIRRSFRRSLSN
jgi:glycosyltransferase involved in cell wall biosynthesis